MCLKEKLKWKMILCTQNLIEAEHTTYFCKIIKTPPMDKKHQMIGVIYENTFKLYLQFF